MQENEIESGVTMLHQVASLLNKAQAEMSNMKSHINQLEEDLSDMTVLYQEADDDRTDLKAICIANGWNPDSGTIGKSEV